MFSHKPAAHYQHTCCQRNCLACLRPSAVQVKIRCRTSTMPCRIIDVHYCRICQRSSTMPLLMHVAIHASSVYVKSRTIYCPDLSSAPAADLISAAKFPTVPLCHPITVSLSLVQSSPKSQLSSAYCCASYYVLPHTHSADFRYYNVSCHPIATIQQCFSSTYSLMDFNPVTLVL